MRTGYWKLKIEDIEGLQELNESDLEAIADSIVKGCTEGEIMQEAT